MPFKKGQKKGPGRPKGSGNKSSAQIKDAFQLLLSRNLNQLQKDIMAMEPKDRVNFLLKLSDKIVPSLKAVENTIETKGPTSLGFSIEYKKDESEDQSE